MYQLLIRALPLAAIPYVLYQVRKPGRWFGQPFAWLMNNSHSALTVWGLRELAIQQQFTILDVGCGGGRTVQRLARAATDGIVYGVDYSDGSVAVARRTNARGIATGHVDIRKASVSKLPFPDATFDLVTAVETHYYWPDLPADVKEVLRVLKPGGTLLIIAESYKGSRFDAVQGLVMRALGSTRLSADEHRELLAAAGYSDVRVVENHAKGWICATGRRPANETG